MNILYEVYTFPEASTIWKIDKSTLRKAVVSGRFEEGVDYRKAGGTNLVTRKAMLREYGNPDCDQFYEAHQECEYCGNNNKCKDIAEINKPNPKDYEDSGIII